MLVFFLKERMAGRSGGRFSFVNAIDWFFLGYSSFSLCLNHVFYRSFIFLLCSVYDHSAPPDYLDLI